MKPSLFYTTLLLLIGSLTLSYGQSIASAKPEGYEVGAAWPGAKFKLSMVKRMDADNVLMAVRVITDETAPNTTFLGSWPEGDAKPIDPKLPNGPKVPKTPNSFSLMAAVVTDEASQVSYKAVPQAIVTSGKFYGPSEIITTMHPRSWLQMSVQFKLPVPLPDADGKIPVQKVDVTLPQAKGPIKGVIVPAL